MTSTDSLQRQLAEHRAEVERVREHVCALHAELPRWGLVTWTSGNISARVPGTELMVIKPSGVSYDDLTAQDMAVCDVHGVLVEGHHKPSCDTDAHAYVYRHSPGVDRGVHTRSRYATRW